MAFPGFSLDGQVAVVTGASRGLGLAIAQGLCAAGAHVGVNGRDPARLAEVVAMIAAAGGSAEALPFDVADEAAAQAALDGFAERQGRLDILVGNVGQRDRRGLFELDSDAVRRLLDVDLVAPFALARIAARHMAARGYGRIVNVTSIAGPIARAGDPAYTAAKGGLDALTKALAAELGPLGITANAVAPGFFATKANAALTEDPKVLRWLRGRSSLRRWGRPDEIAGAAVFLASPAASYVTGHTLVVDGGILAHF